MIIKFINLQGYDIKTKEGWEYVLYFTDGSPTDSTVSHQSDECGLFKNLLNQCLIRSIVGQFDERIGLNYLRGMHLSDVIPDKSYRKGERQNIGL
jgi:hypothetical protein